MSLAEHHTPPEPGAVRSIVAPHMGVTGTRRDMLHADLHLAESLLRGHEADLEDSILTWRHCHSLARATWRRITRVCVNRVRRGRREAMDALRRLAAHRPDDVA